jgi:hypothetical protein
MRAATAGQEGTAMRTSRFRLGLATVALCCASAALAPGAAVAKQPRAYKIESFSLQTTIPREVHEVRGGIGGHTVVNEPYGFTQAGGHPVALTFKIRFPTEEGELSHELDPTQDAKDIVTTLPAGLLGNPTALPTCSLSVLTGGHASCSPDAQVGDVRIELTNKKEALAPIYNVTPEVGQSAEFALEIQGSETFLTAHLVRSAEGYAITVEDNGITPIGVIEAELTFWGVPAESRFDWLRGLRCSSSDGVEPLCTSFIVGGNESSGAAPVPFLTMPTDCSVGPEDAMVRTDSWERPGKIGINGAYSRQFKTADWQMPGVTGCGALPFAPGIEVEPDTSLADEPVGLGVDLKVPQSEEPGTLAAPEVRDAVVTLPEGMSISPGIVDGLQACNQSGPEGINFTGPESEERGLNGEWQLAPGHCPDASTVGTAEAITPLLGSPVRGHVYLARPGCGGAGQAVCTEEDALDGNLYQLYLELGGTGELGNAGVNIKVPGYTDANPATGQLTTKFLNNPQLPFSELKIHLNGGPRAPLDNPAACGEALTASDFTPWSLPGITSEGIAVPGTTDGTPSSHFDVQGCSNPQPFNPGFVAGTVSPRAGAFSSFTLNITRGDREQFIKGVQVHTPPGLLGMLSSVTLCQEPAADAGTCPESSLIGTTRVASGAGSHPFEIEGKIYLTKGYGGAPFGLSIVTPAVAGPFNLGLVVVRARIGVDPDNSALTVTTDETGPHALPQIIFGVPLRLQRITVNIDRPGFMFNPTSCSAQQVTARFSGTGQAVAQASSPFAASGCRSLAFKPSFAVSTNGHTTRRFGASLDVHLTYPKNAMGSEANIAKVKVELPKQLPANSEALKKACLASVFEANPAACPSASVVGIVKASTPVLPVALSGPVYFVSHGGAQFPSLVVVLQGDGVRVDLEGETFINKKTNVTSSTFKTVPDVPVTSFELYLPQGKYSALAANGNLCKVKGGLKMPTEFVAQNGAVLHQQTKIEVTGCGKSGRKHTNGGARK